MKSTAWGFQVWRGEAVGEKEMTRAYKWDWKLVPRDEEQLFLESQAPARPMPVVPETKTFAPLHEYMIMQQRKRQGVETDERPVMKTTVRQNNRARSADIQEIENALLRKR